MRRGILVTPAPRFGDEHNEASSSNAYNDRGDSPVEGRNLPRQDCTVTRPEPQKTLALTCAVRSVSRMSNCAPSCSSGPIGGGCCTPANVLTPAPLIDSFTGYDATAGVPTPPNPVTPWNINRPPASLLPPPTPYAQGLYQAWLATHPV